MKEAKENMKLVHCYFQGWWGEVVRERGRMTKAAAVRDWKLVLRTWLTWVKFVRESKEKMEREEVSRWLQREEVRLSGKCGDRYASLSLALVAIQDNGGC